MRDAGLEQAIKAAGGVASLARGIGIAQPSVSAWSRIPAERVLAVEALTQVQRFVLRPDLYGPSEDQVTSKTEIDEIDQLRAAEYGLLSLLLGKAPDADTLKRVADAEGRRIRSRHGACRTRRRCRSDRRSRRQQGILRSLHRPRPRRTAALCLLLSDRLSSRAPAGAGARRSGCGSGSSARARRASRRITSRSCSRSWPASRAATSRPTSPSRRASSSGISSRGRRGCSPIWRCRSRRSFYRAVGRVGRVFMELESEAFTLSE